MEGVGLATFRRRKPGSTVTVALMGGGGDAAPLLVEFEVPDALTSADCEAAARRNVAKIQAAPEILRRYGLPEGEVTEDKVEAAFGIALAVETAARTWKDWNHSWEPEGDEEPVKTPLTPENIAEVLHDEAVRTIWNIHFQNATVLERSEKKGSGSSPDTNSGEEPTTAGTASAEDLPAPADSLAEPGSSAPA